MGSGQGRFVGHGLAEGVLRLIRTTHLVEKGAEVKMRHGQGGIGGDGAAVAFFRLAKRIRLLVKQAKVDMSPGVARIKLHSPLVMPLCRVGIAGFFLKQAKRKVHIRSVRVLQTGLF